MSKLDQFQASGKEVASSFYALPDEKNKLNVSDI